MLKKIVKINNFGSFKHYSAEQGLENFNIYNLIWGLNGAGKTTLTRFFESLNLGKLSEKAQGYQEDFLLKVIDADNKTEKDITKFSNNPFINRVKIFNQDFIETNLRLSDSTAMAEGINYDVGKENIELRKKYIELKNELALLCSADNPKKLKVEVEIENNDRRKQEISKKIADNIKLTLDIKNPHEYTAATVQAMLKKIDYEKIKSITNEDKNNAIEVFRREEKKQIEIKVFEIIDEIQYGEIQSLLQTKMIRPSLVSDELVKWLEEGLKFKETDTCPFCGQNTSLNWQERYKQIVEVVKKDASYITFEKKLINITTAIEDALTSAKNSELFKMRCSDFYEDVTEEKLENFCARYNDYLSSVEAIVQKLSLKQGKKELVLNADDFIEKKSDFCSLKNEILDIVRKHNGVLQNLKQMKEDAKQIIIYYCIANDIDEINTIDKKRQELDKELDEKRRRYSEVQSAIISTNSELLNQKLPINEIEKNIEVILGYRYLTIEFNKISELNNKGSYFFKRADGEIAKNLSEGEKTVVAFAYFLATLKMANFDMKNSIIVIDDPVSSLDQQYLFNIINLLLNRFSSHKNFMQLFILTHNFYLFKKIRAYLLCQTNKIVLDECKSCEKFNGRNIEKPKEELPMYAIFEIKKNQTSFICNADKYLKGYDSEYVHNIKYLDNLLTLEDEAIREIPAIGNSIRKVLEIFLAFKSPCKKSIFTRFEDIIKNSFSDNDLRAGVQKYKYLQDIANAASHAESVDDVDIQEDFKKLVTKEQIIQLFDFIDQIDSGHFKALKDVTKNYINMTICRQEK